MYIRVLGLLSLAACTLLFMASLAAKPLENAGNIALVKGEYSAAWDHFACSSSQPNELGCLRTMVWNEDSETSFDVDAQFFAVMPEFVPVWLARNATRFYQAGEYQRVVDTVAQFGAQEPSTPAWRELMYVLALSYQALHQDSSAEQVYLNLANTYPQAQDWIVFQAFLFLGNRDLASGRFSQAVLPFVEAYDMALNIRPPARSDYEKAAWNAMTALAEASGADNSQLRRALSEQCAQMSSSPGCLFLLGLVLTASGKIERAQQVYDQACALALSAERMHEGQQSIYMAAAAECSEEAEP